MAPRGLRFFGWRLALSQPQKLEEFEASEGKARKSALFVVPSKEGQTSAEAEGVTSALDRVLELDLQLHDCRDSLRTQEQKQRKCYSL